MTQLRCCDAYHYHDQIYLHHHNHHHQYHINLITIIIIINRAIDMSQMLPHMTPFYRLYEQNQGTSSSNSFSFQSQMVFMKQASKPQFVLKQHHNCPRN